MEQPPNPCPSLPKLANRQEGALPPALPAWGTWGARALPPPPPPPPLLQPLPLPPQPLEPSLVVGIPQAWEDMAFAAEKALRDLSPSSWRGFLPFVDGAAPPYVAACPRAGFQAKISAQFPHNRRNMITLKKVWAHQTLRGHEDAKVTQYVHMCRTGMVLFFRGFLLADIPTNPSRAIFIMQAAAIIIMTMLTIATQETCANAHESYI